jgi:NTP pyrophosphatase (non-canonical NTP hydrolase)
MDITVRELTEYLHENYGGKANEQGMFMKLVEEIGEVAEILNKRAGRKASDGEDLQQELGTELADMIHYIVAIAAINGIDLSERILTKDKTAAQKYHHARDLEAFLKEKRR